MTTVAGLEDFSLGQLYKCIEEKKPVRALGHLLVVVNLRPQLKSELCPVLVSILGVLSGHFSAERRHDDLLKCYREVLSAYSDNEVVLNKIGSQLFSFNHFNESRQYFQLACDVDSDYLPAFRNLQNVTNVLVERWHFRMLNDRLRNESFSKAISKKVEGGSRSVVDIGTGTGLLSLYAKAAGADYVCACDYSPVMASIARQVFDANLPPDSVSIVNKLSTDLRVPTDLPFRCSLVVTETMDSGLLGEHLLTTLDHAWDHLLLPPSPSSPRPSSVIPSAATVFAVPIESLKIARKSQLLSTERLTSASPGALNWSNLTVSPAKNEPYDTENLFTDVSVRYLAEPVELFRFNFNDPQEIKDRVNGEVENRVEFRCSQGGYWDAIAVWFEAYLDDEVTITTSPLSAVHCTSWHHAIFACPPAKVLTDSQLGLIGKCVRGVLSVQADPQHLEPSTCPKLVLNESVLKLLNSSSYLSALANSVERMTSDNVPMSKVIDLNLFPHQGLVMSKSSNANLLAVNDLSNQLLRKIIKRNRINSNLVENKRISDVAKGRAIDEEDDRFDLLFANFIDSRGEISQEMIGTTGNVIMKYLKPNATVVPYQMEIWGQLISSDQIVGENRVTNSILDEKFALSQFMNEYQVSTHLDVRIDELAFEPMSDEFLIGRIPVAAILCRDDPMSWTVSPVLSTSGHLNAVLYWFKTYLYDDVHFSTRFDDSFAGQIVEILPKTLSTTCGQSVTVRCLYNFGVIKLDVL